ncbi:MAG: OmpH family outer membrane protein [Salinibacter sp.]
MRRPKSDMTALRTGARSFGDFFPSGRVATLAIALLVFCGWGLKAGAQQKIGYIDSQSILKKLPKYATVQQKLKQLEKKWRAEIKRQKEKVQKLKEEFRAWELLYTEAERQEKRRAIAKAEKKVEQLRQRYFGPEGQLYSRQKELMRPIQKRILSATEEVATQAGYDYVFDKGDKVLFMYAREEHNLSQAVLRKLGVNTGQQAERGE